MTSSYGVAFLGFGQVARALVGLLESRRTELRVRYGVEWRATGVATRTLGWWASPEGLTIDAPQAGGARCYDVEDWLLTARPDVVFESIALDPHTGQPALDYLSAALRAGVHVVSANKGPIVYGFQRLSTLAESHGRSYRFEAAVMDGAPVFSLARRCLPLARIHEVSGVFTSTATVVLEAVERGESIEDGIREAQAMGIAEADPSYDVDGWDTSVKLCAISSVILERAIRPDAVRRVGIRSLDPAAVRAARREGRPFRLIGRVRVDRDAANRDAPVASVQPERVAADGPLAVSGATLVTRYEADVFPGGLTVTSGAPDLTTTAYGMFADFLEVIGAT
jgi:homoserine dehydrogenase